MEEVSRELEARAVGREDKDWTRIMRSGEIEATLSSGH